MAVWCYDAAFGWVGIDLDGTLAHTGGWRPGDPEHTIGAPVPRMLARVKRWLKRGADVRILTARAGRSDPLIVPAIEAWCLKHVGRVLPITDKKDYDMICIWDDRAIQVELNTGRRIGRHERGQRHRPRPKRR